VWQTRAHAAAFEEDPSYPAFTRRRQALATVPVLALFVHFSGNPRRCLEAPVTEVDVYRTQVEGAETTQDKIRRLTYRIESLMVPGFLGLSWGVALEDISRGVYIAGWRTIEVLYTIASFLSFVEPSPRWRRRKCFEARFFRFG